MSTLPILPIDLQLEIFSYLPCKAILRFMVLSQVHRSLLISPYFISRHHSKSRNKFFVLLPSSITCLCEDDDHLTLFQNLMFPFVYPNFGNNIIIGIGNHIIGICNGVICMRMDHDIFFINPMIRYYFDLPIHEDKSIYKSMYCYGFISCGLSDYLVVKIDSNHELKPGEPSPPRSAWVYTYVENYWRPLKIPDCSICTTTTRYNGVIYYGLLHWGARKWVENAWYYFILTFDPQTEVFGELLLADSLATAIYYPDNDESCLEFGVFVVQNSTKPFTVYSLIFSDENYCTAAVWVMNRYGITESWNQIFTFNCADNYISSTLFGFNHDIDVRGGFHEGFPSLLLHRSDGKLLFGVKFNGKYSIHSLDINHETSNVLTRMAAFKGDYMDDLYIGYSSPSLILLDKVSALRY